MPTLAQQAQQVQQIQQVHFPFKLPKNLENYKIEINKQSKGLHLFNEA